jgi:hypothetical protein
MRPKTRTLIALLVFSTILATGTGCDDSLEFDNTPPGGLSISKNKCYLGPSDSVVLTGEASDNDGDEISYSWTASEGTLTPAGGIGQVVTWRAPDSHGTYRVTLNVTDQIDTSSEGIDLDVGRNLEVLYDGGVLDQTDYPYIVPNKFPITIAEIITVTIEKGVTVVFNEGTSGFNVGGTLNINGTAEDRVLLTPNACPGEDRVWKGVKFSGLGVFGPSTWSYVTLNSTADGLTVEDEAVLTGDNIILDQSSADGLSVKSGAVVNLSNSRIWENGGGVYVANGTLRLTDSSVRYNGNYGFSMIESSGAFPVDVEVVSCVVANNSQVGFSLAGTASPVVHNCSLFLNGPDMTDIRTVRFINTYVNTNPVNMTGNYWGADTAPEIQAQIIREGSNGVVDYSGWLTEEPLKTD